VTDYSGQAKAAAIGRSKAFAAANPGTAELRAFVSRFDKFPADLRMSLRPRLLASGERALQAVKASAHWSARIPAATRLRVSFAKRGAGLAIVVDRSKAPHARPLEHGGRPGTIRHPRWGDRSHWISQPARPFARPATEPWRAGADADIGAAVDAAARKHGFK
jgi:hypothetical protein